MKIVKGRTTSAPRRVIYGPPGVGKTKFACSEPGSLPLDYEDGVSYLGIDRVEGAKTWGASIELVREACIGSGEHTAVVIDTMEKLEEQAALDVCIAGKKKSLSDFGYGDGYEAVATKWRELLKILEGAREKGRAVTLVAHVQNKPVDDPTLGKYGKFIAVLEKRCWTATHRWADAVLFANYEAGMIEGRAIMTGMRLLHTQAATGFDAKHRPNLNPSTMPLDWATYAAAVSNADRSVEEIVVSILRIAAEGGTETLAKAENYVKEANGDAPRLAIIEQKLKQKVGT